MGLFDSKCSACGKRTPKGSLSEGMCPACCDMISFYNSLNDKLKAATGKHFTDEIDGIVKMDKAALQKVMDDAMVKYATKCNACGNPTLFSDLKEGYCAECHKILLDYLEVRDMMHKLFGATLKLEPSKIIKMTEEEWRAALSDSIHVDKPEPKTPDYIFSHLSERPSLELMLECGIKRAKFVTKGNEEVCTDCRKRNGLILPVAEAIELGLHKSDLHQVCGRWVPLRERDENID